MKAITEQQRLEAFALYTMANQHYVKVREYERAVAMILGEADDRGYNDAVSDGIYGNDPGRETPFDEILTRSGIVVMKPQKTGPKKKKRA